MATTDPNASSKSWELSLYELNRQPQPVITDCTEIAVSPRSLHSELMCPICLDMLKTTMTTKECLHRFCQDCIITALRSGNKECPTCRKKLVSKRSLRPDPNFDALIMKIYPSREDYDAQQERVMAKVSKHNFSQNIEETLRMQALNRARGGKKLAGDEEASANANTLAANANFNGGATAATRPAKPPTPVSKNGGDGDAALSDDSANLGSWDDQAGPVQGPPANDVELVIKPLPHGDRTDPSLNAIRYLKTAVKATIDHISKYLEMRYDFEVKEGGFKNGLANGGNNGTTPVAGSSSADLINSTTTPCDTNGHNPSSNSNSTEVLPSTGGETESNPSTSSSSLQNASNKKYPFAIFIAAGPGQFHPLAGPMSLSQVVEKYWKLNRPLELFYAYKMKPSSSKLGLTENGTSW